MSLTPPHISEFSPAPLPLLVHNGCYCIIQVGATQQWLTWLPIGSVKHYTFLQPHTCKDAAASAVLVKAVQGAESGPDLPDAAAGQASGRDANSPCRVYENISPKKGSLAKKVIYTAMQK